MLQIKDSWGNVLCESEDLEKLREFALIYKKENKINFIKVTTGTGMFHCFI